MIEQQKALHQVSYHPFQHVQYAIQDDEVKAQFAKEHMGQRLI